MTSVMETSKWYVCLFILLSVSAVLGQQRLPCFKDRCLMGEEYCVNERQRCYKCQDISDRCGKDSMPGKCDVYCVKLSMTERELQANITIKDLKNKNQHLSTQLNETDIALKIADVAVSDLKEKIACLSTKLTNLERANVSVKDLQEKNEALTIQLTNKEDENARLKLILIFITCFSVVVVLILIIVWSCCWKRKHSAYKAVNLLDAYQENDQPLHQQDQKRISQESEQDNNENRENNVFCNTERTKYVPQKSTDRFLNRSKSSDSAFPPSPTPIIHSPCVEDHILTR